LLTMIYIGTSAQAAHHDDAHGHDHPQQVHAH